MIFSNASMKQMARFSISFLPTTFFLWGCAEKVTYDFPPVCPKVSILPAAADYYEFADNQSSLSHLIVKTSITEVSGNCTDDPKNENREEKKGKKWIQQDLIDTDLTIALQIQQGPAAQEHRYKIPYFVATLHNNQIVDKQTLIADVDFPNNINQINLASKKLRFKIPATSARAPDGYELVIGFQLTPEQLAYNRSHFRAVHYNTY